MCAWLRICTTFYLMYSTLRHILWYWAIINFGLSLNISHISNNTKENVLYPWILELLAFCLSPALSTPRSPGHHLLFLVGGVATTADWMDGCGQEVQPMVFKVLIHQWQDNLWVNSINTQCSYLCLALNFKMSDQTTFFFVFRNFFLINFSETPVSSWT